VIENPDISTTVESEANPGASTSFFKRKKFIIISCIFAALLLFCTIFVVYFSSNYAIIGDGLFNQKSYNVALTELDLRNSNMTTFNGVEKMKNLKVLDIRECFVSVERYEQIQSALPECKILWSIPLGSERFDCDSQSVVVDNNTDFSNLSYFDSLKNVNAVSCTRYDELIAVSISMSDVEFIWNVTVEGQSLSCNTEQYKLSSSATAADISALKYIPGLKYVDASECTLYEDLLSLNNAVSNCDVEWFLDIGGAKVSSLSDKVDLRGYTITDPSAITDAIPYLPNATYFDMCDCGLSNEQMQTLRETYPNIKFVWYISFLTYKNVRTDIQVFSSLRYSKSPYTAKDYSPLLIYCTDLVALDLGHNSIKDISLLTNLKKLKCLILTDNCVVDLTPLAELQELEIVELCINNIVDYAPLAKLPKLRDINVGFNPSYGYNTLEGLQCPERLWLTQRLSRWTPPEIKQKIKKLYPDCKTCYYVAYSEACGPEWTGTEKYKGYRKAFRNWRHVVYFNSWDDNAYKEGVTLRPAIN